MSKKRKIIIALVVLVAIAIFIIVSISKRRGSEIAVETSKVISGVITQTVSGTGRIQPAVVVKISANVSAKIMKLPVVEGENVQKKQLLVELDQTRYEAAVEHARSTLKSAKASYKKAQSDYRRMQDLFKKNLVSLTDLESAEASLEQAESHVEQSEAALKQAADDLDKKTILSPMDGTITQLKKEEGEIALGSQFQEDVIMTVGDLTQMEVLAEVDENDVVLIDIGDSVKIEVDAIPDTILKGIVSEIAHTATTRGLGTQEELINFEVKIAIVDNHQKLRPGMSATVDVETETHLNALKILIQCVTMKLPSEFQKKKESNETKKDTTSTAENQAENQEENAEAKPANKKEEGVEVVFIVVNDTAKIVPIKTGISDDTHIEILDGLQEDDVIVSGSYRAITKLLKQGSKVVIKEAIAKSSKQ